MQAKKLSSDDYRNRYLQKEPYISSSTSLGFKSGSTKTLKPNYYVKPEQKFNRIPLVRWNCPPEVSKNQSISVIYVPQMKLTVNMLKFNYKNSSPLIMTGKWLLVKKAKKKWLRDIEKWKWLKWYILIGKISSHLFSIFLNYYSLVHI